MLNSEEVKSEQKSKSRFRSFRRMQGTYSTLSDRMAFLFKREGPGLSFRFLTRTVARVWLSSSDPAAALGGGGGIQCDAL
jgi:hypothetical protein